MVWLAYLLRLREINLRSRYYKIRGLMGIKNLLDLLGDEEGDSRAEGGTFSNASGYYLENVSLERLPVSKSIS